MDILMQTVRKEGFFALYKGPYRRSEACLSPLDYSTAQGWQARSSGLQA